MEVRNLSVISSAGVAKAWCQFSTAAGVVTLDNSHGVSSITDNGVGDFTVNFTTAFANSNYASALSARGAGVAAFVMEQHDSPVRTVSANRVYCLDAAFGTHDPSFYSAIYYGDQ